MKEQVEKNSAINDQSSDTTALLQKGLFSKNDHQSKMGTTSPEASINQEHKGEVCVVVPTSLPDKGAVGLFFTSSMVDGQLKACKQGNKAVLSLMDAVTRNKTETIVAQLKELSPEEHLDALGQFDGVGNTVLIAATFLGKTKAIKALLDGLLPEERLAALAQPDRNGGTALLAATRYNKRESITALLEDLSPKDQQIALARRGYGAWCNVAP